ncbi:competence protein ComK, partial [Listeria monocytogenes]|nr:competence protein ComK [Listeria monocytogenes]
LVGRRINEIPKKNILSKGCLYFYYYIEETLFM